MAGFQNVVNYQPNPGIEGDFADMNPRSTLDAGAGALQAGVGGVLVGRFAWADATGNVTNAGSGIPSGFVAREEQAFITAYLGETSMLIPQGFPVTLFTRGGFWGKTLTVATIGQKVFASNTDGSIKTGATGATVAGYTETPWYVSGTGYANGFEGSASINDIIKISSAYSLG